MRGEDHSRQVRGRFLQRDDRGLRLSPIDPEQRRRDAVANAPGGELSERPPSSSAPVVVEDGAWIGIGAIILEEFESATVHVSGPVRLSPATSLQGGPWPATPPGHCGARRMTVLPHDWYPGELPANVVLGKRSWLYSSFAFLHHRSEREPAIRIGPRTAASTWAPISSLAPAAKSRSEGIARSPVRSSPRMVAS